MQNIVRNSKALMMISVPHGGSSVATLKQPVRFLVLPSVEVEELRKGGIQEIVLMLCGLNVLVNRF